MTHAMVIVGEELGVGGFNQVLSIRKIFDVDEEYSSDNTTSSKTNTNDHRKDKSSSPYYINASSNTSSSSSRMTKRTEASSTSDESSSSSTSRSTNQAQPHHRILILQSEEAEYNNKTNDDDHATVGKIIQSILPSSLSSRNNNTTECNSSTPPYVVKKLRDDLSQSQHHIGILDLKKEAKLLLELNHPNIVKCFYSSHSDNAQEEDEFKKTKYQNINIEKNLFMVLERFETTLESQIAQWDRNCFNISNELYEDMMIERQWSISLDICRAMNFLHDYK